MAYMTSQDGIIALYQGAAETGPRALGHRSILANPRNPRTREFLNARVKYREAIRPLAPMMTREAALKWFELSDGAADADYNAYNYMVLTAPAKPDAAARIPAVIHADGTGRLQIVREATDPLTHAYLKALGRRNGEEVAVNTSFNVAGPIAQTPEQAIETLRRAKGMDAVVMIAEEGRLTPCGGRGRARTAASASRAGTRSGSSSVKRRHPRLRSPDERSDIRDSNSWMSLRSSRLRRQLSALVRRMETLAAPVPRIKVQMTLSSGLRPIQGSVSIRHRLARIPDA